MFVDWINGENVLIYYICKYVNNVIFEYEKERYINSCNKKGFLYVFILKEDGGMITEGEVSGGRGYSENI